MTHLSRREFVAESLASFTACGALVAAPAVMGKAEVLAAAAPAVVPPVLPEAKLVDAAMADMIAGDVPREMAVLGIVAGPPAPRIIAATRQVGKTSLQTSQLIAYAKPVSLDAMRGTAKTLADRFARMFPDERDAALIQLKRQDEVLHAMVKQELADFTSLVTRMLPKPTLAARLQAIHADIREWPLDPGAGHNEAFVAYTGIPMLQRLTEFFKQDWAKSGPRQLSSRAMEYREISAIDAEPYTAVSPTLRDRALLAELYGKVILAATGTSASFVTMPTTYIGGDDIEEVVLSMRCIVVSGLSIDAACKLFGYSSDMIVRP